MNEPTKHTPLYDEHVALGGKIVPFAGFDMPVQYPTGITAEHNAVREAAGLFDVSHMGEFTVTGPQALDLIQHVTVNDASMMDVGQAQYSAMCLEAGGVIDDLLVYRFEDRFMLVVNASNREKDLAWIQRHATAFDVDVQDGSDSTALLALQGPAAREILRPLVDIEVDDVAYYHFTEGTVAGIRAVIAGTGYTGEDGFELYVDAEDAAGLWRAILDEGKPSGLTPAGLGRARLAPARDGVRALRERPGRGTHASRIRPGVDHQARQGRVCGSRGPGAAEGGRGLEAVGGVEAGGPWFSRGPDTRFFTTERPWAS